MPGGEYTFDVVVRNKGVGHTFPGGTNDSNEGWLEVSVVSDDDEVLALSGAVQDDGHVDTGAHFYKALMVDAKGQAIHRRNAQDIVTAVYVRTMVRVRRMWRTTASKCLRTTRGAADAAGSAAVAQVRPRLYGICL